MELNQTKDTVEDRKTTNFEGGEAYEPSTPEMALTKVTINNLLEDTFYEEDTEQLDNLRTRFEEAADSNPEFALAASRLRKTVNVA